MKKLLIILLVTIFSSAFMPFADAARFSKEIDLNDSFNASVVKIIGENDLDNAGTSVASGDFNADGFEDIVIGAPNAQTGKGVTYIVFGSAAAFIQDTIDLKTATTGVKKIIGRNINDRAGFSVAVGNINGDAYDDVIIGAYMADPQNRITAGEVYVVYGSSSFHSTATLNLATTTSGVTRFYGGNQNEQAGYTVSAGDINGDNIDDVLIGSPYADIPGRTDTGKIYVAFGSFSYHSRTTVDLNTVQNGVLAITGEQNNDLAGYSLASGDIDNDGDDEIVIGAYNGYGGQGGVYVVQGYSTINSLTSMDLLSAPAGTVKIYGEEDGDHSGASVFVGDLNGDSYADLIIGAPGGANDAGETNIFRGGPAFNSMGTYVLGLPNFELMRVIGVREDDGAGSVVSAGDLNGDGKFELIIGASAADSLNGIDSGESYIIWSDVNIHERGVIDLSQIPAPAHVTSIHGASARDMSGSAISFGTFDGDVYSDIIIASPQSDPSGRNGAGEVYIIKGFGTASAYKVNPVNGSFVSKNTNVTFDFNSDIASITFSATGTLSGAVTGVVDTTLTSAVFTPDVPLKPGETVTITVDGQTVFGDAVQQAIWSFGIKADENPPQFLENFPVANENNVAPNQNVTVKFSGDVLADSTTVLVTGTGNRVIALVPSWADSVLTLANASLFNLDEHVTVTISAADIYGDRAQKSWFFDVRPEANPVTFSVIIPADPTLVPVASPIQILFPDDIDSNNVDIQIEGSLSGAISSLPTWVGHTVTFDPSRNFLPGETFLVTLNAMDIYLNAIVDSVLVYTVKADEIPPTIVSRSPEANENLVNPGSSITIEFSEDVARDSTSVSVFSQKQGAQSVTSSWLDYTLTLSHAAAFALEDNITVTVNTGDLYANREVFAWTFNIRSETVAPSYTLSVPGNPNLMRAMDPISLVFPPDVDIASVTAQLQGSVSGAVGGTWAWNDTTYVFTPSGYSPGETLTLSVSALDYNLNEINSTEILVVKQEELPPTVSNNLPFSNQVFVSIANDIIIAFNEPVNHDSTTVRVEGEGGRLITMSQIRKLDSIALANSASFREDETITVYVAASDLYDNSMEFQWSFSTGSTLDISFSTVTASADTSLMGRSDTITLLFSEAVDKATVTTSLNGESGTIAGTWAWSDYTYTFTPSDGYALGESLVLTVNGNDIHGNIIPEVSYSFSVKLDDIPPSIISRSPAADLMNIDPDTDIVLAFSIDTLPDSTTVLISGSTLGAVAATSVWAGNVLSLTPSAPLPFDEIVTVTVSAGDQYANRLDDSWIFTVKAETEPPYFTMSTQYGIPGVLGTHEAVNLVFPADIDKQLVDAVFTGSVSGVLSGEWVWTGTIYTFTPVAYELGEDITLIVNATDINGNSIPETTHAFTVKADEIPPSIVSRSPESNAIDIFPDRDIVIEFSSDTIPDSTIVAVVGNIQGSITMTESWSDTELTLSNDTLFNLNEIITVTVDAGDAFANRTQSSWSFTIKPDVSPPVVSIITPGDAALLSANAFITLVFPVDIDTMSVDVSIKGSLSEDPVGTWEWSGVEYTFTPQEFYSLGETLTLTVNASDLTGNELTETTETFTVGDHVPWLDITAVSLSDTLTHTYRIDFEVGDPDDSYTLAQSWMYSVDGSVWVAIPETSITGTASQAPGEHSISWTLPGELIGVYSENIRFRMDVFDGRFASGYRISPSFKVDRNEAPVVAVLNVTPDLAGERIYAAYTISDAESDSVSLNFEYSYDSGTSWFDGVPVENISDIPSGKYTGSLTWNYMDGLTTGIDYFGFRIRLTPGDYKSGITVESEDVNIDLNDPPSLSIDDIYTTQSGDVAFTYHIVDAESDSISLVCYYSVNGGVDWNLTGNVTGTQDILDYGGSFIWQSKKDIPTIKSFSVSFRAIPSDHDEGTGDETEVFQLFNNAPPTVVAALPDTDGNFVTIPFTVADADNDPVTIHATWSLDGETWTPATVEGDTLNLPSNSSAETLVWNSLEDIGTGLFDSVYVKLTVTDEANPFDSSSLNASVSALAIDNQSPELSSITASAYDTAIHFRFNEQVNESPALEPSNYLLSHDLTVASITRDTSKDEFVIFLGDGESVPFDSIILKATGISDVYGNITAGTELSFFPDDNNDDPVVSLSVIPEEIFGNVPVLYQIIDTESDTISLTVQYSSDSGVNWIDATISGVVTDIAPDSYTGSFDWLTTDDISGMDGIYLLRVTAYDKQGGEPFISNAFRVDNNTTPSVQPSVADPDSVYFGMVSIAYLLTDAENDTLSVDAYYSLDDGVSYLPMALSDNLTEIDISAYTGSFEWDTDAVLPDQYADVLVKLVPSDNDTGAADSIYVRIDNYGVSRVALSVPDGDQVDDITVSYIVTDPRERTVDLNVEYSIDSGQNWLEADIEGEIIQLNSESYEGSFVWNSTEQLKGYDGKANLWVTPDNGVKGIAGFAEVTMDYNLPPTVVLQAIEDEISGDAPIVYVPSDDELDTVTITLDYSIDNGSNWYAAATKGDVNGIPGDGKEKTITWNSADDLPGRDTQSVLLRMFVADSDSGGIAELKNVHVDNNATPTVMLAVDNPDSTFEDYADISYILADQESNMLGFDLFYSLDGGLNFSAATITGKTTGIFSSSYASSIRWEIASDLTDFYGDAIVKFQPFDSEPGEADNLTVKINTFGLCTVALTLPSGEQTDDIPVNFEISDEKSNVVSLIVEYSVNSGTTWFGATTEGAITDLDADNYSGSFVWKSAESLVGRDGVALLRVTPNNGADGDSSTSIATVDYNEIPSITASLTDPEQVYSGEMLVTFMTADPESDILKVNVEYSVDGGSTFAPATVTNNTDIRPGLNVTVKWSTFVDIGFSYYKDVTLRLTPSDHDSGLQFEAGPFTVTNLIGDFTNDLKLDGDDLPYFINAWNSQELSLETGPVTGMAPELTIEPDGVIDFEDLTGFIMMWNWYTEQNPVVEEEIAAKPSILSAEQEQDESPIHITASGDGSVTMISVGALDYMRLVVSSADDGEIDVIAGGNDYWNDGNGMFLTRSYQGEAFEIAAAKFGDIGEFSGRNYDLGTLHLDSSTGDVVVSYSVRLAGSSEIIEGAARVSRDELYARPEVFELTQNFPNPFNPTTAIGFSLPNDNHVQLVVRAINGQVVEVLRDEFMYAGHYSVRWDAADAANGVYFYTLTAGDFTETRKMVLVK